jgi:HEAT repeat protein
VPPEPPPPPTRPSLTPLSPPIGHRTGGETIRGRIQIEDDDRPRKPDPKLQELDGIIADALQGESSAIVHLRDLGEPALRRIAKQFPGELDVNRRDLDTLPPLPAHGALIRVALEIGPALGPYLVEFIDHPNPAVRFYIAFVFMELRHELAVAALGELAFDPDADVRAIAMRVLETYSGEVNFLDTVTVIRRELDSPNRTRALHATRAVGTLRDIEAVPKLIELLTSKERYIQEASLESLCSVTGQQLGLKPHRWESWYGENSHHHRVEWIMSSLAHKDLSVRRWAADELRRITGQRINFLAAGSKQEREIGLRKWIEWWDERGRAEFGGS